MNDSSKKRGRPIGSETDDSKMLEAIADKMVGDVKLKATAAMRLCKPNIGEAEKRRLQIKWKGRGAALLEAAKSRRAASRAPAPRGGVPGTTAYEMAIQSALTAKALYDSPTMRAIRAIEDSPTVRAMRALEDSPTMRAIRQLEDSPVMKIIRDYENSPMMRAIKEHQRLADIASIVSRRFG